MREGRPAQGRRKVFYSVCGGGGGGGGGREGGKGAVRLQPIQRAGEGGREGAGLLSA